MPTSTRQEQTNIMKRPASGYRIAAGIFFLALIVRLIHLWTIRSSPFFDHLVVDSVDFDARATAILRGTWREEGAFYQAPLYPFFLAAVYKIFGHSLTAVRAVQAVLGSLTAAMVSLVGRRLAGGAVGAVAGILAALYAMSIHFDAEILRPSLVMFLSMLCLHLLLSAQTKGRAIKWAAAGLVLGLAAVARPTLLMFIPVALIWVYFIGARTKALSASAVLRSVPRFAAAALFFIGAAIPIAVVTGINYTRSHNFVLISYNGGINFFVGNNAEYEETISIRPGIRWDLLYYEPNVDPVAHPSQWSRYYYDKAAHYIRSDPAGYSALIAKKLVLFWNGREIERNMSFSHAAGYSPFMAYPVVSFRWMAPLALVGLIIALRKRAGMGLPVLFLVSQMAAVVAFFVCARYRMVAVPVMVLLAGYAAVVLVRELRMRWLGVLPYAVLLAVAAVLVNVDWYGISSKSYARDDYELALVLRREGRLDECMRLLNAARAARPDDPDVPFQMGVTLLRLGENDRAAEAFEEAAALEPGYALTWFNLGISNMRRGDASAAVEAYEKALEMNPSYWEAAHAVGRVLEEAGRLEEAVQAYTRSLNLARSREERGVALVALGIAYAKAGEYEQSLERLDEAIAANASLISPYLNKARVLKAMGRDEDAVRQAEYASRLAPSDERVKALLEELRR